MSSPANRFVSHYILHNLGLKLLSLALAVGLWLAVAGETVSEVAIDVPIAFHNMPANLDISSENIPRAEILLRGPQRNIRHIQPSDIYAEIELSAAKPGERTFDLTARQVHHPHELTVVQVIPSEVHLVFDLRLVRDVPVQPHVTGTAGEGYQVGQIQVDPPTVKIAGPKRRVEAVDAATTDALDVSGAMDRRSFVRHPYVTDPLIQVATPDPVRITVIMEKTSAH